MDESIIHNDLSGEKAPSVGLDDFLEIRRGATITQEVLITPDFLKPTKIQTDQIPLLESFYSKQEIAKHMQKFENIPKLEDSQLSTILREHVKYFETPVVIVQADLRKAYYYLGVSKHSDGEICPVFAQYKLDGDYNVQLENQTPVLLDGDISRFNVDNISWLGSIDLIIGKYASFEVMKSTLPMNKTYRLMNQLLNTDEH